jgi:NAD(P)-dependent dehydrogenase (short-subunit alcohol dehydrogenase family)
MKTMIITGASRGIGAATARLAAEQGFAIIVNYQKNQAAAEKVVADIISKGGKAAAVQADISREKDILRLFSETDRLFGNLQSLINNAGILERQMRLEEMEMSRLNRIFSANITGQLICSREAIKRMSIKHGGRGGTIVNVSSIAARTGAPNEYIDYAVSKGAIDTFTIGLSKEVADDGIRVNCVRPAFIYTDIHADGGEPGRVDRIKENIPMKRGGTAQEVAEAILWLVSEKSSYSTGAFIDITGGK